VNACDFRGRFFCVIPTSAQWSESNWRLTAGKILEYKLEYNNRFSCGFQTSLLAKRPFFMPKN